MEHTLTQHIDDTHQTVTTLCTCGLDLIAAVRPDQEHMARYLGYPSIWLMDREHDVLHLALCQTLGLTTSPTLHAQIHGNPIDPTIVACEEAMTLAAQRFYNVATR